MKRSLILFSLCLSAAGVFSQNTVGIKAGFGLTCIQSEYHYAIDHQDYMRPSGLIGFVYQHEFPRHSVIGVGLEGFNLRGKMHTEKTAWGEHEDSLGIIKRDLWRTVNYLSVPVYYGFRIRQLTVSVGVRTAFMVNSRGMDEVEYPDLYGHIINDKQELTDLHLCKVSVGPMLALHYQPAERWEIELNYWYGMNNINATAEALELHPHAAILGLTYNLITFPK